MQRKDPQECALLYVALGRVKVLQGLYKASKGEPRIIEFLGRNFEGDENDKRAAQKNALALLAQHR